MIREIGNKGSVNGQVSMSTNDYFAEYFAQLERTRYLNRFKNYTPLVKSGFGPQRRLKMVMEIQNKGRVKSQASMSTNDYFAEYFEQWKRWESINRFRGLTQFKKSTFGP